MTEPRFSINPNAEGILRSMLAPAAEAGARILVDAIKDTIEEAPPRTGRTYLVPGTRTPYTASAPGEVPAVREAHYRDSWESTKAFETPQGIAAAAVSNLATEKGEPIGLLLEDGTRRMAPRPHLREGINRAGPQIDALVVRMRRTS